MRDTYTVQIEASYQDNPVYFGSGVLKDGMHGIDGAYFSIAHRMAIGVKMDRIVIYLSDEQADNVLGIWELEDSDNLLNDVRETTEKIREEIERIENGIEDSHRENRTLREPSRTSAA